MQRQLYLQIDAKAEFDRNLFTWSDPYSGITFTILGSSTVFQALHFLRPKPISGLTSVTCGDWQDR
jgi:hypothetical protein